MEYVGIKIEACVLEGGVEKVQFETRFREKLDGFDTKSGTIVQVPNFMKFSFLKSNSLKFSSLKSMFGFV